MAGSPGGVAPAYTLADSAPTLWYSSDATYAYQDSTGSPPGTTPAAAAQPVGTWRDRGSAANHAVQTTGIQRPTASAVGPLRVTFDGSDDSVVPASATVAVTGAQVLAVKFRLASTTNVYRFVCRINGTGAAVALYVTTQTGTGYKQVSVRMGAFTVTAPSVGFDWTPDTAWHDLLIEYDGVSPTATTSYSILFDGVAQTVAVSGNVGASDPSIGAEAVGASKFNLFNGDLATLVYLARALTGATERTNLRTAVAAS